MVAQIETLYQVKQNAVTEWNTRALQLAESHDLARTGRGIQTTYDASGIPTLLTVRVASQSQAETFYDVRYDLAEDRAACRCDAARWGKPCAHAGEALRYGRYVAQIHTSAARAEAGRMAARDLAHEENAASLGY